MRRAKKILRLISSAIGSVVIALPLGVIIPIGAAHKLDANNAGAELVKPFKISVDDAVLRDLNERLDRTRLPNGIDGAEWEYGVDLKYLQLWHGLPTVPLA
jgi:hypothetical protein